MRYLAILILFFATAAQAENYQCKTRKAKIDQAFVKLCPVLEKQNPKIQTWTLNKCATLFFEAGMRDFRGQLESHLIMEKAKQDRRSVYDRLKFEFDDIPIPPEPTPSVIPTQTPTPIP